MPRAPGRQLHLNLHHLQYGYHAAAWRYPSSDPAEAASIDQYVRHVQRAEEAKLDAVFLADLLAASWRGDPRFAMDPLVLLSVFAIRTRRIGLVATASTTFLAPFHLARK